MKTPREILLTRHESANPKLDHIRRTALSAASSTAPRAARNARRKSLWPVPAAQAVWQELIRPCRRAWAGMVALWLVMWGINWGLSDAPKTASSARPVSAPAMFEALEEQRRLLAELVPPSSSQPAEPPRRNPPPRNDRHPGILTM